MLPEGTTSVAGVIPESGTDNTGSRNLAPQNAPGNSTSPRDKHPCCKRQIARFSRPHTARRTVRRNVRISASHEAGYSAEIQPRSTFIMQPPRPPAGPTAATYRSPTNAAVLAGGAPHE